MKLDIKVKQSQKRGLGIFATRDIAAGEVIEKCPVIPLSPTDREHIANTPLDNYIYPWKDEEDACMVLGYGSLINHSYNSNANWQPDRESGTMNYVAVKDIKNGEEITVNYNGDPDDQTKIDWFEYVV